MSFLDSPICRCERMHTMVVTDQTQRQCMLENNCPPGTKCPLCGYFEKPVHGTPKPPVGPGAKEHGG